ncbi:MAG: hypothetical protein RR595_06665 [Lysinibacillus sp.]
MRKIYTIELFEIKNQQYYFSLNDIEANRQLKAASQVIADSDNCAFIYLLDSGEDYHYLHLPPAIWPQLVHILQLEQNPYLKVNGDVIELTNFFEELQMLVYNIEGNYNYGEKFVKAVEESFQAILV